MVKKTFYWSYRKLLGLWADSLYRNSFWIMAGSFSMAGIGFFYWIIAARLYSPEQIGLATTFLSAAALVSSFSILGFGTTILRYLPTSNSKAKQVSTAFTVVIIASLVMGIIYLLGLSFWTPKILFIRSSIPLFLLIILFFPLNAITGITDSVFTALRSAHWVFVSNITQSITKLIVMVLLAGLGVWGVIGSYMMAVVTALILSLFLIFYVFNLHLRPTLDQSIIKKLHKFAFGNYVSGLIGSVPGMIVPIFITNHLSPEQTAYFYMPNMIGSMLLVVPSSIAKSYFTESSSKNTTLSIRRPMYAVYSILFPIVVLIAIIGKNILNIFGTKYSIEGYNFLLCVSISTLISVVSYFYSYRLLIKNQLNKVIKIQLVTGVVYLSLVFILSSKGILGVGVSIIISKIVELVMLYKSDVSKA